MRSVDLKTKLLFYCLSIFFFSNYIKLSAGLKFASRTSAIVLQTDDSRIRIGNNTSVEGWEEQSIVKASGMNNSWVPSGTIYGDNVHDTTPPTHLIYSNSNAINALNLATRTNSQALLYGIKNNSNAIILDYAIKRQHSNAFAYGIKNNSNGIIKNKNDIATNVVNIATNATNIATNVTNIRANSQALLYGIKNNSNGIIKNKNDIATNVVNIATNATNIATNVTNIRANSQALLYGIKNNSNAIISSNDSVNTLIRYNSNAIVHDFAIKRQHSNAFAYGIKNNSNGVIKNKNDIATNATNIATNVTNIRANSQTLLFGIKNNSNTLLYNTKNNSNSLISGITNNSNAIILDYAIKRQHSNAFAYGIKNNSNTIISSGSVNSTLIRYNSNAIVHDFAIKRQHSNAFAYAIKNNSNGIIKNKNDIATNVTNIATNATNIAANAADITINQNAIVLLNGGVFEVEAQLRHNSMALLYGIKNNSNALVAGLNSSGDAISSNSQSIVAITEETDVIVGSLTINQNTTLQFDLFISEDDPLNVTDDATLDANGHFIQFAHNQENYITVAAGKKLIIKNAVLKDYCDKAFSIGAGGSVIFGDNVCIQFNKCGCSGLYRDWIFHGENCGIYGYGDRFMFRGFSIIVNGSLSVSNMDLDLRGDNIYATDDASSITMRNVNLIMNNDYTFSTGALNFQQEVALTGTNQFTWASSQALTIDSNTAFYLEAGSAFRYAPSAANRDLFALTDLSSQVYLSNCELSSSSTGLRLTKGILIFEGDIDILSADTSVLSEGISFGNGTDEGNLDWIVMPSSVINIEGILNLENTT